MLLAKHLSRSQNRLDLAAVTASHGTSMPRLSPHGSFPAYTSLMYTALPSTPSCGTDWWLSASTNTCSQHNSQTAKQQGWRSSSQR